MGLVLPVLTLFTPLCVGFLFGIRSCCYRLQKPKAGACSTSLQATWRVGLHIESLYLPQVMGFAWLLVLFLVCGLAYGPLTGSAAGLRGFQTLYFVSSFWAQFGPNATTFLVVRALLHRGLLGLGQDCLLQPELCMMNLLCNRNMFSRHGNLLWLQPI